MARTLIIIGVILVAIGIIWHFAARFLPLGKLPGDLFIKSENMTFYFPIVTCIILSIVLSVILSFFRR
ncbi:hypothetical protein JOC54_001221 [Alkalihalobacillus xiaoxiensis]|uniref:DUF2905 domain-containing protein n=1 Tax=Shouchella xiaoxiensis TaxID=766895 RepID=A0ABS2ST54_9BACI|nr:DUF2905 domain-containing protein [Shouchella xiaoxiensis]MBM7837990.1 hypothetical protein [Shouchella xiaoxiensis]